MNGTTTNCTFTPVWFHADRYYFQPNQTVYLVLASLGVANTVLVTILVSLHVTRISRKICRDAWDEVCETFIGSDDDGEHELEEEYLNDVGQMMMDNHYNKPLFEWSKFGWDNRYVYNTNPFRTEEMTIDDQRKVHIDTIDPKYMPRGKAALFIGTCIMIVIHETIHLLGYLFIPTMDKMGPENMMFLLIVFFLPKGLLMVMMILLSFRNGFRHHAVALHGIPLICLTLTIPKAVMSISTVSDHISPFSVILDWTVVFMSLRLFLWFPYAVGKASLKDDIHRYIRAFVHSGRSQENQMDYILRCEQKDNDRVSRRQTLCLPHEVQVWETSTENGVPLEGNVKIK